jgi:hypothetical protein
LKRRKWRWIGNTLRKPKHNITRQALQWNPQGKCGRGRPRNTWRRYFIAEMEIEGYRWQELECLAQNRTRWRTVVSSLCTTKVQQAQAKQVSIPFPLAELSPLLSSGNETGAPGKRA